MSKRILIVDDEADVRAIVRLGLEMGAGWSVLVASSGQEALNMATLHQPDAIMLDMMMPDMDGRATLQRLKANPATRSIPVILVTAKVQSIGQDSFADLDVATVIAKPFRPLNLAQQISDVLCWNQAAS